MLLDELVWRVACTAGITRRERQLVEILLLSVDGDRRRAAALATEHVEEFAEDTVALTIIDGWFRRRGAA